MQSWIRAALVALGLALAPAAAVAQVQVAVDVEAIFPKEDVLGDRVGFGVAGRVGYLLPGIPFLDLVPEAVVSYTDFASPEDDDVPEGRVVRVMGGARASIGTLIRPTVFAHLGYGSLSLDGGNGFFQDRTGIGDEDAFAWDAGVGLDFAILPLLTVGAHGAYNRLATDTALDWWSAGVHGSLLF